MTAFTPKRMFLVAAFLLAMTFCNLTLPFQVMSSLRNGYQDFTIYYMGASLLRNGQASALYDLPTQYRTQSTFTRVPIRLGPLPYNHPPFEALLFVPFTLLGYWPAYLLWTALNLIMLAVSVIVLRRHFPELAAIPPLVLGLGATAFFPVAIGIMQGQDVILLLLLFVLAVVCLDRGNDAAAGALLAAGLFRPHLVVAVVVLLAIRRWRVLLGFAPVAIVLAGISVAIMGWRGPLDYVRFVLRVEGTGARGFGPQAVPNFRGLFTDLPGLSASGPWVAMLILASSVLVFFVALYRIRNGQDSISFSFSLATITAILVSFHVLTYDLCLLLPLVLFLLSRTVGVEGKKIDARTILVILLFLTPLYVFLLFVIDSFFWFSLILLWLYLRLVLTPAPAEVPA
ncbi:MAG TPA: glycosyltransferase family 87 protein [Terriglobales bacterium]|nr:glycosyltransferase family 87 protein [Terriglobales bacterium]